MPGLMGLKNADTWAKDGKKHMDQVAADKLTGRLAADEKPYIDPEIETRLTAYVNQRKNI